MRWLLSRQQLVGSAFVLCGLLVDRAKLLLALALCCLVVDLLEVEFELLLAALRVWWPFILNNRELLPWGLVPLGVPMPERVLPELEASLEADVAVVVVAFLLPYLNLRNVLDVAKLADPAQILRVHAAATVASSGKQADAATADDEVVLLVAAVLGALDAGAGPAVAVPGLLRPGSWVAGAVPLKWHRHRCPRLCWRGTGLLRLRVANMQVAGQQVRRWGGALLPRASSLSGILVGPATQAHQ